MGSKNGKFKTDLEIEKAMYMAQGQPQLSKFFRYIKVKTFKLLKIYLESKTYRAENETRVSPLPENGKTNDPDHIFLQPPPPPLPVSTKKLVPILVNSSNHAYTNKVLSSSVIKVKPIDISEDGNSIQADEDHERKIKHREKGVRFSDEVIILNGFDQLTTSRVSASSAHQHQPQATRNNHKCIKIANILRDAYCANIIDRKAMKI